MYDNDIEHLKKFFGSYRTLKLRLAGNMKQQKEKIAAELPMCSVGMTEDEDWITVLVDEEKRKVMDVLGQIQNSYAIRDMQLEEISTEEVIRKIYEGAAAERKAGGDAASSEEGKGGGVA